MSPAEIVIAMHRTWAEIPRPAGITQKHWLRVYHAALGMCISNYFAEEDLAD
jgi:hypothetical protein